MRWVTSLWGKEPDDVQDALDRLKRQLPVAARDMLAHAELHSGGGVLRDVIATAYTQEIAPAAFAYKMRLYAASAVMTEQDKAWQGMITAVTSSMGTGSHSMASQDGQRNEYVSPNYSAGCG